MKNSAKIAKPIIVIAIIFILAGGVFCGAAYAFGENYMNSKTENCNESFESAAINKLEIGDHVANINITKSGDGGGNIIIKAENVLPEHFKCETANNVLKISYNPTAFKFGVISVPSFIFDPASWNRKTPVINIYVPEGKLFGEINFKGGVGNIRADEIIAENFIIGGGMGNYDITNMTTVNLKINGGMGNIDVRETVINGESRIDGGVGNVSISGKAGGNITVKGGVGNIDVRLSGDINDYNIKADSGIGSIRINGSKASEIRNSSGRYNINIDGGVGNINIDIR